MAELTITTFVTLDGVMQAPGGPDEDRDDGFEHGGWVVPHFDAGTGAAIDGIFRKASAFLLGRRTYDIFAGWWPNVTDPDDLVAAKLNTLPKHVASRSQSAFSWAATEPVRQVAIEVEELKRRYDGEIQVHGSSSLAQTLIAHGLIDEYRIITFPVVVGSGKRLFGTGTRPATLELVESHTTENGIVVSVFRKGGELRTGLMGN